MTIRADVLWRFLPRPRQTPATQWAQINSGSWNVAAHAAQSHKGEIIMEQCLLGVVQSAVFILHLVLTFNTQMQKIAFWNDECEFTLTHLT